MQTTPDPEPSSVPDAWCVLVCRLPLAGGGDLSLGASLTLRRLPHALSISDLAALGASGFHDWAALAPFAAVATAEIVAPTNAADSPAFDALRRWWLVSALLVIRGFAFHVCPTCSAYPWSRIAGHRARSSPALNDPLAGEAGKAGVHPRENLPKFQGRLLDCHPGLLAPQVRDSALFDSREAAGFAENFERFDRLASLVGTDSRLVYRVAQRVAAVIAPRGPERLAAFKKMKTLNDLKPEASHEAPADAGDLLANLQASFEALRALLLDAVERGGVRTEADFQHESQR